ncbi:hypothetical protein KAR34_11240 [bacterium]|nr:hypothetical protein [bacterium]
MINNRRWLLRYLKILVLSTIAVVAVVFLIAIVFNFFLIRESGKGRADRARAVLDTPFLFVLDLPKYELKDFSHDVDIFSAWGYLVLKHRLTGRMTLPAAQRSLMKAAVKSGWKQATSLLDMPEVDISRYGIGKKIEDLRFYQTHMPSGGKLPPTRYTCRLWILEEGGTIVMSYHVDSE